MIRSAPSPRNASTARRKPSRSFAAIDGDGGPLGRRWRNGRLQRNTKAPAAEKAFAAATSRGALEFPPAPWVKTSPWLEGLRGRCSAPSTPGAVNDSTVMAQNPTATDDDRKTAVAALERDAAPSSLYIRSTRWPTTSR